jgi:hypothetical protein
VKKLKKCYENGSLIIIRGELRKLSEEFRRLSGVEFDIVLLLVIGLIRSRVFWNYFILGIRV